MSAAAELDKSLVVGVRKRADGKHRILLLDRWKSR